MDRTKKITSASSNKSADEDPCVPVRPVNHVQMLGVDYHHYKTDDGGDLYLTQYGKPFCEQLQPENWYVDDWFDQHRQPLKGTSTVYRMPTRPVQGRRVDMVVKWCRVGQDVPLQTHVIETFLNTEFNSPFEEFALVEELRQGDYGPPRLRILTHRPLAIYVPPEQLQLWQTGRSRFKINKKVRRHPGVEIDILRQYILIYEWIKGVDAAQASEQGMLPVPDLHALTRRVTLDLRAKGFLVADMKPAHIIVRPQGDRLLAARDGQLQYALIDFELLQRTPEHQRIKSKVVRADYLVRQRDRFDKDRTHHLPANLFHVHIFNVDYVYGRVESTDGALWVVGRDPRLSDFYQPERWRRTPSVRLSENHQVFYTKSKDDIHLVWKTSRVGEVLEIPAEDSNRPESRHLVEYGYNSPFEEFAFAIELSNKGIPTTNPRAIYMTGSTSNEPEEYLLDDSRFRTHHHLLTPDGLPILRKDHDYIKIWGYWNGPIERLAELDSEYYQSIDLMMAFQEDLISSKAVDRLLDRTRTRLAEVGYQAPGLEPHHLLLSADSHGMFINDHNGELEARLCNFETVRRLPHAAGS